MQIDEREKEGSEPGRKDRMCQPELMNPGNPISAQNQGDEEASWEDCQEENPPRVRVNNSHFTSMPINV